MKLYKLTDDDGKTRQGKPNETQWGEGVTHSVTGKPKLCTATVLHAYPSALLAVLMDPTHGSYGAASRLWEAEGEVVAKAPDKVGCQTLTTLREIDKPVITPEQRAKFAILAAQAVIGNRSPKWSKWAEGWLSGKDRTARAADAATNAATNAAYAAYAAARAADAATNAADAAANAANAANATNAAYAATNAATAAYAAARAADLDLVALAEEAMR
jgi:hypothetical protein